jgi:DNA primase
MDVKDQIKRNISIIEVASLYVNLKPAGKYYKGLCPFHTEKTPSFFVKPENDTFTCYGCNKFGDMFTLIQEMENISFPEAINFLIEKFNIPVDRSQSRFGSKTKKDEYLKITDIALAYFVHNLNEIEEGKKASEYLKGRGISPTVIELFSLGYAQNSWDGLYRQLRKQGCPIDKAIELGLVIKKGPNRVYDRFRGRIIFPIFSESGAAIAFGGRTVFDDSAKYLNSPDTPLYKKGKNLYCFNFAKKFIRESNHAIVVEGYFDAISLYQHGIKNVVATLGTALTEDQIKMLKRFADDIYMFYDSDQAGITATLRGIEKMFEQDINPKIILSPGSKDPDDFIREKGLREFRVLLEQSTTGFKFLLNKASQDYDLNVPERKRDAVESVKNFLIKIDDPIVRSEYSQQAAEYFIVDEEIFRKQSKRIFKDSEHSRRLAITPAERGFIEAILVAPELIEEIQELLTQEIRSVLVSRNIIRLIFKHYNQENKEIENFKGIFENLNEAELRELREINWAKDSLQKDKSQLHQIVEKSFLEFQKKLNQKQIADINRKIKMEEKVSNFEKVEELMVLKNQFVRSMHKKI